MVRQTESHSKARPIELVIRFARYYRQGDKKQYDQLFFFSPDKDTCNALKVFGGRVYKQYGGWRWMMGNKKQLIALAKLMTPESELSERPEMKEFVSRMLRLESHEK